MEPRLNPSGSWRFHGDLMGFNGDSVIHDYSCRNKPLVNCYTLRTGKSPSLMGKLIINGHFQWLFVCWRSWKITIFNGKTHYSLLMAIFNGFLYVGEVGKSPSLMGKLITHY